MDCPHCQSSVTTERPERTARGSRRFRRRTCQSGFNERVGTLCNCKTLHLTRQTCQRK
jgi:putative transposase